MWKPGSEPATSDSGNGSGSPVRVSIKALRSTNARGSFLN